MTDAGFFTCGEKNSVSCDLCFRACKIPDGGAGFCGVRFNRGGVMFSPLLGKFCACAVDPIEKKPLYHWRPGSFIFSLGSFGCTMDCVFCQNHEIARPKNNNFSRLKKFSPQELSKRILDLGLNSAAFTYNEPTLQAEFICECSKIFRDAGIAVVLVTNGAMSETCAGELISCTDAANIDLKAFDEKIYKKLGGNLEAVKNNIVRFINSGVHVEVTSLIVPALNDDREKFAEMVEWLKNISRDVPLHITRYFPRRDYHEPPTDINLLYDFAKLAREKLSFVHVGNV